MSQPVQGVIARCGVCHTDLHYVQGAAAIVGSRLAGAAKIIAIDIDDTPAAFAIMDGGNVFRSVVVM